MIQETRIVKSILNMADLDQLNNILNKINFSKKESKVISMSTFDNKRIIDIAVELDISLSDVSLIKRKAYKKIYDFCKNKDFIKI